MGSYGSSETGLQRQLERAGQVRKGLGRALTSTWAWCSVGWVGLEVRGGRRRGRHVECSLAEGVASRKAQRRLLAACACGETVGGWCRAWWRVCSIWFQQWQWASKKGVYSRAAEEV